MKPSNIDTIAAVSTPSGEGGIGIVRMSGNDALAIAAKIFRPADGGSLLSYASHTVHYGKVTDPSSGGRAVDEALLTVMRGPSTYTKEDVVEINCHGGKATLKKVLELCLAKGARLAEPGEFTKRAFLGGRIDLSQAEAVLDVIKAETDIARSVAMRCLEGEFSKEIKALRERIMDVIAMAELSIDFSQEDVEFPRETSVSAELKEIFSLIKTMIDSYGRGMVIREGASVVICGRPNVGKSSLMNALLRHDRVIVTPIAGTTRDVIEESIDIKGVKVRLSDTAGIIETRDRVEIEGIKRSRKKLEEADVVVFVLDSNQPFSSRDTEIYETVKHKKLIVVANKTDLARKLDIDDASRRLGEARLIAASTVLKEGLLEIENALAERLLGGSGKTDTELIVTNARHKDLLEKTAACVERAVNAASEEYKGELIASDLNEAVHDLGLIVGESIDADVLDRIFSRFCIGK